MEFRGGNTMKNQNVLKTTWQISFSPRAPGYSDCSNWLAQQYDKFSQHSPCLQLLLCHTEAATGVSSLFSVAREHQMYLNKDAEITRFLS